MGCFDTINHERIIILIEQSIQIISSQLISETIITHLLSNYIRFYERDPYKLIYHGFDIQFVTINL